MRVPLAVGEPGWFRVAVPGDGNCAFYALAACLNYLDYRNADAATRASIGCGLRARLLGPDRRRSYRAFKRDRGFEGLGPRLEEIAPPSVYAGDFTLSFVAWSLRPALRIVVLAGPGGTLSFGTGDFCVVLCHIDTHDHFEAVCKAEPVPEHLADDIRAVACAVARHGVGRSRGNARATGEHAVAGTDGLRGIFHVSELPPAVRDTLAP